MWVCGSGPWRCTLLVVPIYVCGFFFLWRRSCVPSPPVGGGVGSYWASFGVAALPFFLGHLRFSAACHAASCPSRVPHLADSGWLPYSCSRRLAWSWGCLGTVVLIPHLVSTLCRRNSPFRFFPFGVLPLDGCVSMSVSSLLVYSWGWVGWVFAASLGFLPCPRLFLRACGLRSLPSCWLPWFFFSGHWLFVLQLPWWRGLGFNPSLLFLGFSCSACLLG